MSNKPLISVIVPLYNAERSIGRCIDSILAQTFREWELIVIDDGSRDGGGSICDHYALSDGRIRVIHKPNEGVAATRMRGIEEAQGDYSIQVDADDWVEPTMLEELYGTAQREGADMVICDFVCDYSERKPLRYVKQQPSGQTSGEVLLDLLQGRVKPYCWNKLVRHECYRKSGIRIPTNISHGEDFYVSLALLRGEGGKVAYQPKAYYHYVQDEFSNLLTRTYTPEDFERDVRLKNHCAELMAEHPLLAMVEERNAFHIVRRAFNGGIFSSAEFKERTYEYRNLIRSCRPLAWHRRWRLFLSCIGLYRLMYGYKALKNLTKKN